jgi:hypothetical protein
MKLLLKWAKELVMLLSLYTKSGVMLFLSKIHSERKGRLLIWIAQYRKVFCGLCKQDLALQKIQSSRVRQSQPL